MKARLRLGAEDHDVEAVWSGNDVVVTVGDRVVTLHVQERGDGIAVLRDGPRQLSIASAEAATDRHLWVNGRTLYYEVVDTRRRLQAQSGQDDLIASVPGTVQRVLVQVGDHVEVGQTLVVMESMKMEMALAAPHAGIVEEVCVAEGETVEAGTDLVKLASDES